MKKLYLIHCYGLGDILATTPSLRKLSKAYEEKIDVVTHNAEIFKNNPYVNKIFSWNENIDEVKKGYEDGDVHDIIGGYQLNHSFDIRALHAKYLGFGLLPEEMEYDFIPDKYEDLNLPLNYICIHPAFNWESRTWPQEKWQELINSLIELGHKIVITGKSEKQPEIGNWQKIKYIFKFKENPNLIDLSEKANLSQTWHIINRAEKFITMDTGLLHLAGCTNTEIVQLGSSINYKFRAPFRMGSQEYRYTYVGGDCDIFCASDLKYAVKEHGKFDVTPPLWQCLEGKKTFECHPSVQRVLDLFSPAKEPEVFEREPELWQKELGVEKIKIYNTSGSSWAENLWNEIIADRGYERYFKIKEDDIVFDIGANVGYFALSCAKRKIKHCYCFEPMPSNFLCLNKNITELEDSQNFTLIQKAISPCKEIYVGEQQDQTTPYTEKKKTNNCTILDTVKLVDFTKENKIKKVDFIKMDIEGGEWDIFESEDFEWILKNTKKFVAELHLEEEIDGNASDHRKRFNTDFISRFRENGFSTKVTSIDGQDIEYNILANSYLADKQQNAHDYYNQIIFYAWRDEASILDNYSVQTSFVDGAFCELSGNFSGKRKVSFVDAKNNQTIHETSLPRHHWSKPSKKHFVNWRIKVEKENGEIIHDETFDAKDKRVLIHLDSKSLGDNIAWIPYVEEFRKKHDCHVVCSCFKKELFEKSYPDIEFVEPGVDHEDLYASYQVGWFDDWTNTDKNPTDPRTIPLQQTASDILGLDYKQIKPRVDVEKPQRLIEEKYVCISTSSTAGCKHWQNPTGWQDTVDYLNDLGFKVVVLQKEPLDWMDLKGLKNVEHPNTENIHDVVTWLNSCEFFIGIGSGVSWLAWALNKKVVLISGFSKALAEFHTPYRVINEDVCNGCWNDKDHKFDKGDWNWCPEHKNTDKHFECSKEISFETVKEKIDLITKKVKIGVQIMAYNCAEAFPKLFEPWMKLKDELNLDFWVHSRQFKIYEEMGVEDSNSETLSMLKNEYSDVIDYLSVPEEALSDHESRSLHLDYCKKKDIDLILMLDTDEFYTEEQIRDTVNFVKNNPEFDWYAIQLKNYVGDDGDWVDFAPPRIIWTKRHGGIKDYYWDNNFIYNDGEEYRLKKNTKVPKDIAFPDHYTWTNSKNTCGPNNIKDKIEYQKRFYSGECGYKWNEDKQTVERSK
jgi:autotransporter strand-loop-strand O-heptosyltransferase